MYVIKKPDIDDPALKFETWDVVFAKSGRLVTAFLNVSGKLAESTEFITLFTVPKECAPCRYIVENYITQTGNPMLLNLDTTGLFRIFNNNKAIDGFLLRQCITYISAE